MKPKRIFRPALALAMLVLFLGQAGAYVSSQEALNFVCTNAYLSPKECPQARIESNLQFNSKISLDSKQYWLITVFSGDSPSGFIAVEDAKAGPSVPALQSVNTPLFKTIDTMRALNTARTQFSGQKQWLFTASNAQFFSDLSRFLSNEKSDLDIIGSDSNSQEITSKIHSMEQGLDSLSSKSSSISKAITAAIGYESDYFLNPDASKLNDLRQEYDDAIGPIDAFKQAAMEYDLKVRELKPMISSGDLPSDQKAQFVSLADAPSQLYQITSISSMASSNSQSISSAFQSAESKAPDLAQNLALRLDRVKAYNAIYKEDSVLSSSTSKAYSILKAAYEDMTSEQKKPLWTNQERLLALQADYPKALKAYDAGNYSEAFSLAGKAKEDVISILRGGAIDQTNTGEEIDLKSYTLPAVGLLIALLAIIFVYSNRKKFFGRQEGDGT